MRTLLSLALVLVLLLVGLFAFQARDFILGLDLPGGESAEAQRPFELAPRAEGGGATAATARVDPAAAVVSRKNARAVELLNSGELEEAVRLFEECVAERPGEPVFQQNLSEALARLARVEHAESESEVRERSLERLARAVELNPAREDLAGLLARWRRTAATEKDFWHKTTEHFVLSFDGARDELMWGTNSLEIELERAYHELGERFGRFPVEEGRARIRVVLYRREDFDTVTGLGDWAGGAFDGTVRVPVEDLEREEERLKKVLRHELVHAFVQEYGGAEVPGWLNEGLAQLYEAPFVIDQARDARRARERLAEMLGGRELFNLERLGGNLSSWTDPKEIELAYVQSHVFVAYLERMYGERILFEMVTDCGDGVPPQESFRERMGGLDLDAVLEDLARGL